MLLTKTSTFIIGPVATLLGYIMNAIFWVQSQIGIESIGLCIILFTIVIYMLLLPLTIKQQKFSRLQSKMNPELQAIQKKYKGKNQDQAAMMKMNEETQAVYQKYGVNPMGSCLQMVIQMPILFALYRVIWNIPAYVASVKDVFTPLVNVLLKTQGTQQFLADTVGNQVNFQRLGYTANSAIDALYKFKPADWTAMAEKFPDLSGMISQTTGSLDKMNYFLGLNISNSPMTAMVENFKAHNWILFVCALAIPVLAGLSQWLNTRLMPQAAASPAGDDSSMESSMKMMNNMMPLVSVFFCLSLPIGLGIYWIAGAVFRGIQQVVVNKHMEKMDMDALIRKNVEKMNAKRKKQGLPPKKISEHAKVNFKDLEDAQKVDEKKQAERQKKIQDSTEYYKHADAKPGSIAAKARMVQQFDEKNPKGKKNKN